MTIPGRALPGGVPGKQFGSFDGKDNRRDLWMLLERLGDGVDREEAHGRRYSYLVGMCRLTGLPNLRVNEDVECTVSATYWAVVGLATSWGLDIEQAVRLLEMWVRKVTARAAVEIERFDSGRLPLPYFRP